MNYRIAIDIGGTQLRAALYPLDSHTPQKILRTPTQGEDIPALERLANLVTAIWPDKQTVEAIGVAVAGPLDPYVGILRESPNIPGWIDLPLRRFIEDRFKVPVAVGNDANLAALAEWKYGAGQGHHHLIYITVSTGIGGGVIVDDRLLLGAHGLAAELGHLTVLLDGPLCGCGQRGHLEAISSGPSIVRWVEEQISQGTISSLAGQSGFSAKEVAAAALLGDQLAKDALSRAGTFLGLALADYLHIFNPSIIIIGGGVSKSGDLLLAPMRDSMKARVMSHYFLDDLKLANAALGDEVGLMGALALSDTLFHP